MAEKKKYPAGIQTFSEIIEDGYLYVDKTTLIFDLIKSKKYVFLSRPRRFGKSLLVSTLEAYFRGERELFKGLAIYDLEKDWKSYPVFRFDLSGTSYQNPQNIIEKINLYLSKWEKKYRIESSGGIATRFSRLLYKINEKTGKDVVILIDEYDNLCIDNLDNSDLHDSNRKELRGFYSVMKESDEYIKFVLITGISKLGQDNIFNGLNNLRDISLLPQYNAICGFTESEFHHYFQDSITIFAKEKGLSEDKIREKFKTMYNGYLFADKGERIYNPYGVLNAFNEQALNDLWFSNGIPPALISLIKQSAVPLKELEGVGRSERALTNNIGSNLDLVVLLYHEGFLTIKSYDPTWEFFTLDFPNEEVKHIYSRIIES